MESGINIFDMEKKRLYFAAPMFNLADTYFNAALTEELENYFTVELPQRDGFEFSKLHDVLETIVAKEKVENIANHLIYYLDIGFLLTQSDFCLARLDEPSDPGVDIEVMAAKELKIPRIGYRTDVRTPYGSCGNEVRGAHFFTQYNCDVLINFTGSKTGKTKEDIGKLAHLIYKSSREIISKYRGNLPHKNVNLTAGTQYVGHALFRGIDDLHSETGLREVVRRYTKLKEAFGSMRPGEIGIVNC
ncbi:hypothetical protein A3K73_05010 [Candidatus Pacearchaeota archaeon RBG_13_36_9]|nr:MAG: hypothetical protein A3K73_05010 [Candidatus Pacearchaeota archaeon RBG_13_36_9]